jgi:hypothetical protein
MRRGFWDAGWLAVTASAIVYILCLIRFLVSGGTPAKFFTRHLGFFLGEDPRKLVQGVISGFPKSYDVGVLLAVSGQAMTNIASEYRVGRAGQRSSARLALTID